MAHAGDSRQHAIVIGAGMGGMATAIRLAVAGWRVTVYEAGERPGGKVNRWSADGWTFDTGPSLLTMPWVLRELFAAAGRSLDDYLTLDPVNPICRYHFADGTTFEVTTDTAQMAANIERLSPQDVPNFFRFLAYTSDLYAIAGEPFLRHPMDRSLLGLRQDDLFRHGFRPRDLLKFATPRTVHGVVSRFFHDPRLVQVFDRYATYNGSSPYHAPAAFCIIPFVEFGTGAWHPRGGIYKIAEALAALAADVGVRMVYDAPVEAITVRNGAATGVRLADGDAVSAAVVVSNADIGTTYEQLLSAQMPSVVTSRRSLRRPEPSYSGFLLLLGTRYRYPHLAHHTISFSADYRREFDDLVRRRVPPTDPTIYICRATATDPAAAPEGCDTLFVMVNVPYLDGATDWRQVAPHYRDLVLRTLTRRGFPVGDAIAVENIWTPETLRDTYGAGRGAIYGFASNTPQAAFLRPGNRARGIGNLYFAGGTVHPGGGVPLALLSGQIAATMIAKEHAA